MFSALVGIIGIIIGIIGAIIAQRIQRKEKFMEILYKERLAVYKQILERFAQIHIIIDQHQQNLIQGVAELHEIKSEAVNLGIAVLDGAGVVSNNVFNDALYLADIITHANTLAEISNCADITAVNRRLIQTIRKELGVKPLSDEIIKTLEFPGNLVKKVDVRDRNSKPAFKRSSEINGPHDNRGKDKSAYEPKKFARKYHHEESITKLGNIVKRKNQNGY